MNDAATAGAPESRETFETYLRGLFHDIKQEIGAEAVSYVLHEPSTHSLRFYMTEKVGMNQLKGIKIPASRGIAGWVANNQEPIILNDPYSDERFLDKIDRVTSFETKSILCVPMLQGKKLYGVAQALNKHGSEPFSAGDLAYAQDKAAEAMEQIAAAAESEHDGILLKLKEAIVQHIVAEAVSIYVYDEKSCSLIFRHTENRELDKLKDFKLRIGQGLVGWAAQERKPLLLEDAYEDDRFYQGVDNVTRFRTKSVMCIPIMDGEELLAVLQVINRQDGQQFNQEHLRQLIALTAATPERHRRYLPATGASQ